MERMNNPRRASFIDQVRRAVMLSGMSRYELARESDVSEAVLCRFVNGKAGLSMESFNKVADVLGMEVVARRGMPTTAAKRYGTEFVTPDLLAGWSGCPYGVPPVGHQAHASGDGRVLQSRGGAGVASGARAPQHGPGWARRLRLRCQP
jgi:hypothetical protein